MLKRIITAAIGAPIVILILYANVNVMLYAVLLMVAISIYELLDAFNHAKNVETYKGSGILLGVGLTFFLLKEMHVEMLLLLFCFLLWQVCFLIFNKRYSMNGLIYTQFSVIVIVILFVFLYYTRLLEYGEMLVFLPFILAWSSDTMALVFGLTLGKNGRRLCPEISPKKSVIGAFGGLVGSLIGCIVFLFLLDRFDSVLFISPMIYGVLYFFI